MIDGCRVGGASCKQFPTTAIAVGRCTPDMSIPPTHICGRRRWGGEVPVVAASQWGCRGRALQACYSFHAGIINIKVPGDRDTGSARLLYQALPDAVVDFG